MLNQNEFIFKLIYLNYNTYISDIKNVITCTYKEEEDFEFYFLALQFWLWDQRTSGVEFNSLSNLHRYQYIMLLQILMFCNIL